jgi:hypothetical protein
MGSDIGKNKPAATEQASRHSETDSSTSKPGEKQSGSSSREGLSVELTLSRISNASSGDSSVPRRLVRAIPDMRLFKFVKKSTTKETNATATGQPVDGIPTKVQEPPTLAVEQEAVELAKPTRSTSKRETTGFFRIGPKEHPARPPSSLNVGVAATTTIESETATKVSLTADNMDIFRLKVEDSDPTSKPAIMSVTSFRKGGWDSVVKGIQKSYGGTSTSSIRKGDKTAPSSDKQPSSPRTKPTKKPKLTGLFKHKNDPPPAWSSHKSVSTEGVSSIHSQVSPLEQSEGSSEPKVSSSSGSTSHHSVRPAPVPPVAPERGQPLPSPRILPHQRDKFRGYFGITNSFDDNEDGSALSGSGTPLSTWKTAVEEPPLERRQTTETCKSYHQVRLDSIVGDGESKARSDALLQLAAESEIPEHYAHSPLCPEHPQHPSGGKGWCPQHARMRRESAQYLSL